MPSRTCLMLTKGKHHQRLALLYVFADYMGIRERAIQIKNRDRWPSLIITVPSGFRGAPRELGTGRAVWEQEVKAGRGRDTREV